MQILSEKARKAKRERDKRWYKENRIRHNEHLRNRYYRKKEEFFSDKSCIRCGTKENLVLHHIDPSDKRSSTILCWSVEERDKELEKCEIVCHDCHVKIHKEMGSSRGENNSQSKLNENDIRLIRSRIIAGDKHVDIAKDFNINKTTVSDIKCGKTWSYVK